LAEAGHLPFWRLWNLPQRIELGFDFGNYVRVVEPRTRAAVVAHNEYYGGWNYDNLMVRHKAVLDRPLSNTRFSSTKDTVDQDESQMEKEAGSPP
jgi:hypothetical protein